MMISHDQDRRRRYLHTHEFNRFLPEKAVKKLQLCRFGEGEYLCREEEQEEYLYFLVEGRCKVTRFLSNGKEALTCFLHNFAVLGEVELFQNLPEDGGRTNQNDRELSGIRSSVKAIDNVWCLRLPQTYIRDNLMEDSVFLRFLCRQLCQKMIRCDRNLSISLNYPVNERLASYIFCGRQNGIFQENYTHLAEYLGCSHRQLLRVLRQFCEEGILKKEQRAYRIMDEKKLEKLAGDVYSP